MDTTLFLVLDLTGTFAFALNGAWTAIRVLRLDIVGVLALGMITALGGGMIRDVLLGAVPPATFQDGRYLAVAAAASLVAFVSSRGLHRLAKPILVLDAAGLSLFAVSGALKAMALGIGPAQAVILGAITAVGGGTLRDVLIREVPAVLTNGLYAIPALLGALVVVGAERADVAVLPGAAAAAAVCFAIRMLGLRFRIDAPGPPGTGPRGPGASE